MAYPDSKLLVIDKSGYNETRFEETNHYAIYKSFINNPEKTLNNLFKADE